MASAAQAGPWGKGGDVFIALVPIIVLLVLILKPKPEPATFSLPVAAFTLWVLRMLYFESLPNLVNAAAVQGILNCATPVAIGLGAIILFRSMHYTKCLDWLIDLMKKVSHNNPIAIVMIIGWGFVYLVEGAAGFGTPNALAAPILQSFDFDPISVACLCLANDSLETTFGAVGTPIFFGLSTVTDENGEELEDSALVQTSLQIAIINFICSLVVPVLSLSFVVPWSSIKKSLVFIYLSIIACSGTAIAFASFSYNFPTLLGGVIGILVIMLLSHFKIGLNDAERYPNKLTEIYDAPLLGTGTSVGVSLGASDVDVTNGDLNTENDPSRTMSFEVQSPDSEHPKHQQAPHDQKMTVFSIVENTFPIWGTIVLLVITRVPQIGLIDRLQQTDPHATIPLGTIGHLQISRSANLTLTNIFDAEGAPNFNFAVFFVPWFIPFILVAMISMLWFRERVDPGSTWAEYLRPSGMFWDPIKEGFVRMKNPTIALAGATCLAALLTATSPGENSPATQLGIVVSGAFKDGWVAIAVLVGALGAFFAGSTTVSNLTFAPVQSAAAINLGLTTTSMLALQAVGGNLGNMIAIGNIVLVKAIMGTVKDVPEGVFVWKNLPIAGVYAFIATACGFILLFGIE